MAGKGGRTPGAGRKSKAEEMGLKELLDRCWTVEQREHCVRSLAGKAGGGDMESIKLLMSYAFGKPRETKDITGEMLLRVAFDEDVDV